MVRKWKNGREGLPFKVSVTPENAKLLYFVVKYSTGNKILADFTKKSVIMKL